MRIPTPIAGAIAAVSAAALVVTLVPASATVDTTTSAASTAVAASDQRAQGTLDSTVRGEFGRNGTVRGTFTPKRFIVKKGEVFAEGVLHAVMRRNNNVIGRPDKEIRIPVNGGTVSRTHGPCQILNLVLGPLDLNLLGLEVHLKRVVLDIVAVPGPGNLLGNLLCAIAHLLDPFPIDALERLRLANLLNRVLGLL
ncbi:MAG: hypothetical protein M3353_05605 [Actinomycetota bacterium]|nr:hypothetical protein [Actinomycetota bacterium]